MSNVEIKVPVLPESVPDATIVAWHVKEGEAVTRDQNLLDLETDKVVLEVPAPTDGVLKNIQKQEGDTVVTDEILALIDSAAAVTRVEKPAAQAPEKSSPAAEPAPAAPAASAQAVVPTSPSVRKLLNEHELDLSQVSGSGKAGRVSKEDVVSHLQGGSGAVSGDRPEQRVPMSRLRARIAERLLQAQQNAAILTTFNEVNLQAVMDLRKAYKEKFEKRHGVKLGFMSFFIKAAVEALKRFPAVNASIDDKDVVYHGYYDVGVAVSTERGLVVPVIRDVDILSMADIEKSIVDLGTRAKAGQITMEDMTGGTFTVTNGGVFGSMLSTPILNPPQSAILGMHKIEERAMVEKGQVVVRPMMYLALSYDHRIIDGKDSVQFLVAIKELLEDPTRLLLDI